ncbi:hypothetical protein [Bdellovibrio sp. HCB337]|uniref:hypothetical protein n=1 Tax=Bdellovibrio sp. HCB337 TaxID=3394358 RepID=UPI0039A6F77F
MKKALKVIAVVVGSLLVVLVIVIAFFIKSLPSTWEIKQTLSPRKAQNPSFATNGSSAPLPEKGEEPSPQKPTPKTHDDKVDESKILSQRVLHEDFLNEKQPLSSVCANLPAATQSRFLRKDESGSSKEFLSRLLDENEKDPLVESAAPLFRYLTRLPSMRELFELVEKAEAEHDQSFTEKAWFYGKVALVAQELRGNKSNIDRLLMKTYNMYMLSKAVAQRPELARDPATLNFCDQIEKNINFNLDFNPEEQAHEFQKFLDYAKVNPKHIGYDSNYRSNVNFEVGTGSVILNKIWLEELFAADIKKAREELEAKEGP